MKRILRGSRREETARFIGFRSHWRFDTEFCTPAEAHDKGGVEGDAGHFRGSHWVPVSYARDLEQLKNELLTTCREDQNRQIAGKPMQIGAAMVAKSDYLLPFTEPRFDLAEVSFPIVDGLGCVGVRTNTYSVPLRAGTHVQAKVYSTCRDLA